MVDVIAVGIIILGTLPIIYMMISDLRESPTGVRVWNGTVLRIWHGTNNYHTPDVPMYTCIVCGEPFDGVFSAKNGIQISEGNPLLGGVKIQYDIDIREKEPCYRCPECDSVFDQCGKIYSYKCNIVIPLDCAGLS